MRLSITTKIFLGFIALLVVFGGVSTYTLVRMHDVQEDLRVLNRVYLRLNEAYLQLNLLTTEVHTLQNNLVNFLDVMPEGRNPLLVARWIQMARTNRLKKVKQGLGVARQALSIRLPLADRNFLIRVIKDLNQLSARFRSTEKLYKSLFDAAGKKRTAPLPPKIKVKGSGLKRRERGSFRTLRKLSSALRRRIKNNLVPTVLRAATRIERTESRAFYATIVWVVLAAVVGLSVMWLSQRTLRPLRRLADGARRIGRGEYGLRVAADTKDEVGTLGGEFNAMAEALQEREARLIETAQLAARAERLAAMGQLAAQITHEVRNPLSSIGLNAEMLEEELAGSASSATDARELLTKIQKEVDRLTEITEEYLQFARLPSPKLEPEDMGEVVGGVFDLVRQECTASNIEAKLEVEDDLPTVMLDENQIRRAVLNVVRNAMEAIIARGDGGQLAGAIRTVTDESTERVELSITDNGPGIPAEAIKQVFEPFYSTKEKGTGLGLAITQQIVSEHSGRLTVDSEPEKGTTFIITLPARQADKG